MKINISFKDFKKKHKNKKNQVIFHKIDCKNNKIIENLINNFLIRKNTFIFESVEKRTIRGRYTIIGLNPDKSWDINKTEIIFQTGNIKKKIKSDPLKFLNNLINNFNIKIPKGLPDMSSLLVGYFSYDIIRYIEKIPNNCKDDLRLPDVRIFRPKSLVIYDNLKKKIYYIENVFSDISIKKVSIESSLLLFFLAAHIIF